MSTTDYPKKLIEVSIPLQEINAASAREKSIRHGHPSTLHLWWARRPLAAARAVLFCQLVDDPSGYVDELMENKLNRKRVEEEVDLELDKTPQASPKLKEKLIERERERLHKIVKDLVIWENTTNEDVLNKARKEIQKSWKRTCKREGKPLDTPMPPVLDPFAGGGAIPLEAQRLGMEAHASDLNPVAVLINKAMIEIPPKFADLQPINPDWQAKSKEERAAGVWKGAQGLAEDVRFYGEWMREQAQERIGHLYPKYELTQEILDERPDLKAAGYEAGNKLTVIAWLWARTVPSPNPALDGKPVPLVSSFWLSKKKGKEAYVEPVVENGTYKFEVRIGIPPDTQFTDSGTKSGRGAFVCLLSGVPFDTRYIQEEGCKGNLSSSPIAVVCEGKEGRVYMNGGQGDIETAAQAKPSWAPGGNIPRNLTGGTCVPYGLDTFGKLFTDRQLVALTTFSDLVSEAKEQILADWQAGAQDSPLAQRPDEQSLESDGIGPQAYADAVTVYLGFIVSKCSDYWSSICSWHSSGEKLRNTFGRQAIPMVWDYTEANPFCSSSGTYKSMADWVWKVIERLPSFSSNCTANQQNASVRDISAGTVISTDPPYYDNIGYADLSDYFYVWIRRSLRSVFPDATSGILVPKDEELIAAPYRQGGKEKAEKFFLEGMSAVANRWASHSSLVFPTTIYYAFKQAEIKSEGIASTGWATFLGALLDAGYGIVGTWPVRTEMVNKIGQKANMLASSIVLVCRQRDSNAPMATRREFIQKLESEIPEAIANLLNSNIAPVDLPQSAIGPGMAIFSRFSKVVEADGSPMSVTTALQLINKAVDEVLSDQESEMDDWTRFAVTWFSQNAFKSAPYGDAENIANARDVAVDGVVAAGIIESGSGKVRIIPPAELPENWDPETDTRLTIWEIVHHLIRLIDSDGELGAATVLAKIGGLSQDARKLCYQLYNIADQNKWADEARAYNTLITAWPELSKLAEEQRGNTLEQGTLAL